uniref:Uncharacterized protein n=1 Tax=Cacopsylla melanoneura TaxID=428564 RepID=A0A8D8ZSI1_9HEMI
MIALIIIWVRKLMLLKFVNRTPIHNYNLVLGKGIIILEPYKKFDENTNIGKKFLPVFRATTLIFFLSTLISCPRETRDFQNHACGQMWPLFLVKNNGFNRAKHRILTHLSQVRLLRIMLLNNE